MMVSMRYRTLGRSEQLVGQIAPPNVAIAILLGHAWEKNFYS
jgi:hypothetical protein